MSQSVAEPTEENVDIAGLTAGVEVPPPLPTESIVRRGINGDIFVTLRQVGNEPAIHILREQDAAELNQLLETVLNDAQYREKRVSDSGEEGERTDTTAATADSGRPLADEQTHRLLSALPVTADMEPIREWLLGDRPETDLGYREWMRVLQQTNLCLQWSTKTRGVAGYAMWTGGDTPASDADHRHETIGEEEGTADSDTHDQDADMDNLRVQLSTGTTTTGERAVDVLLDVTESDDTAVIPIHKDESPFDASNGRATKATGKGRR